MKHIRKFALACLLLANYSAFAATPSDGWYWGLLGGITFTPSISGRTAIAASPLGVLPITGATPLSFTFIPTMGTIRYGVGGDGGGHLGYRICNFRVEGELLFNYSPISSVNSDGIRIERHVTLGNELQVRGQTVLGAFLFNGYYDFYDDEYDTTWVPYLGLGIGYAGSRTSLDFAVPQNFALIGTLRPIRNFTFNTRNSRSGPVAQGIIGISYYYSDDLSFGLDYRFTSIITTNRSGNSGGSRSSSGRVQLNALNLNFRYSFDP